MTTPTYTDQEIYDRARYALANACFGQTKTIGGRAVTFPSMEDCLKIMEVFEHRIQNATNGVGGNIALGGFDDPV